MPPPHVHDFGAGETTTPATCAAEGVITYTCSCGAVRTEPIPMLAHQWSDWSDAGDGAHSRTCAVGGETETGPHAPGTEWAGDEASHYHVCEVCGGRVDEAAHAKKEFPVMTEMEHIFLCAVCGAELERAAHAFDYTDNGDGTHSSSCAVCGRGASGAAHVWDGGTVTTPATCASEGVMTYACVCGAEETQTITRQPHTDAGGTGTCDVCGQSKPTLSLTAQLIDYSLTWEMTVNGTPSTDPRPFSEGRRLLIERQEQDGGWTSLGDVWSDPGAANLTAPGTYRYHISGVYDGWPVDIVSAPVEYIGT